MWHAFITYTFTRDPWLPWFQGTCFLFCQMAQICKLSSAWDIWRMWWKLYALFHPRKHRSEELLYPHLNSRLPYQLESLFPETPLLCFSLHHWWRQAAPDSVSGRGDLVAHTVGKLRGQPRCERLNPEGPSQRRSLFLSSSAGSLFRDVLSKRPQ